MERDERVQGGPRRRPRPLRGALLATLAAVTFGSLRAQVVEVPLAFSGVRVFDGVDVHAETNVLVEGGVIVAIGPDVHIPREAVVIAGAGRTLLPGLIDAHVHVASATQLRACLDFGVTLVLDMFMDHRIARDIKARQAAGMLPRTADLRSAGTAVTVERGHCTQFAIEIPTLGSAADAEAFVAARAAEGADWIKIVRESGSLVGGTIPTLTGEAVRAVVQAAHARGLMAVVHAGSLAEARDSIEAGVDGLNHVPMDAAPDVAYARLARSRGVFVIPTLCVLESICGVAGGRELVDDSVVGRRLGPAERAWLGETLGYLREPARDFALAVRAVRLLHDHAVPILAGTDVPCHGIVYGASLHHELRLLVEQVGLTPKEALAAATSVPARCFGLSDRGRIAPRKRADLLLVDGDPTRDVLALRRIVDVWKDGIRVPRR